MTGNRIQVPSCDGFKHQSMPDQFFIGIDGGASSCRARLRDVEGNLLGEGLSGPANIHLDLDLAKDSIRAASRAAIRAAGLDERILHRAHAGLGLAGAGLKSACDRLRAGLNSFASTVVATDAYIAWLGAHRGGNGGIVILGTGSCGLAIVDGKRIEVGGWGAEISDEAGGHRMGREALRRSLWSYDGRAERTKLSDLILDRYRRDPAKIVAFAASATPAQFGELAPLVFEYASRRDPLAVELVQETADAAARIIDRLVAGGVSAVSLIGGLAEPLMPWLPSRLRDFLAAPQSDPLDGAILMARHELQRRRECPETQRSSAA
jgi:glucosamine kinase